jgi:DNA-binding NarL/FixJ family response regulator/signal transduction histidine kinase
MTAPPAPASARPRPAPAPADGPAAPAPRAARRTTGDLFVVGIPPVLLLLSVAIGLLVPREHLLPGDGVWALLPSGLLLALRPALERALARTGPDSGLLRGLYTVHLLALITGVLLNPFLCIYAFVGYIDGERFFTGAGIHVVLVLTALTSAAGQSGGLLVFLQAPWVYVILAAVNLLLAGGMSHLSRERTAMLDERERALAALDRTQRENARLQEELLERARRSGVTEERTRLSREIHDTVAQGLVGVIRQLEAVGPDLDPGDRRRVETAEEAARESLFEARRAVAALAPFQLDRHDLPEALGELVARWARTHRVVATVDADGADPDGAHGEVLLRIAQEALANIARHARAQSVMITLRDEGESRDRRGPLRGPPRPRPGEHGGPRPAGGRGAADPHPARRRVRSHRPGAGMSPGGPGADEGAAGPGAASSGADTGSRVRALVVDDHPVVRDGLVAMLGADEGVEVVGSAQDGAEALRLIARTRPDVVLMDLRMPGMGGTEAIRELRRTDREHPRVLVLTTYDTDRHIRGALEAGADGFLLKDARREELLRAVHDLAAGRPVLTSAALAVLTSSQDPRRQLSAREAEVLRLVADGCTNRAVGTRLGIGEATVKTHLGHVYEKLGVTDRASAVRTAWELGLV